MFFNLLIFDIENRLWKYDLNFFTDCQPFYSQNTMVSFEIVDFWSCFFGPTMFEIPQLNWYLYGYGQKFTFRMQGAGVHAMTCFVPPSLLPTNFLFAQPDLTMANFLKNCPKIRIIMQLKKKENIRSLLL